MLKLKRWTGFLLGAGMIAGFPQTLSLAGDSVTGNGIAVVELFTSEGCSSCPPADAVLADLVRDAKETKVFALAFHVDYWDDLGWPDPFAQHAFTERQGEYRRAFKLDSLYTPQAVVNGQKEVLGSNRVQLRSVVATALGRPADGTISIKVSRTGSSAAIDATTTNLPAGTKVCFAVVQNDATTDVRAGENGGRTLRHRNVVRAFASVLLDKAGQASATLTAPRGGWPDEATVIVFAQNPADFYVLTATGSPLPK